MATIETEAMLNRDMDAAITVLDAMKEDLFNHDCGWACLGLFALKDNKTKDQLSFGCQDEYDLYIIDSKNKDKDGLVVPKPVSDDTLTLMADMNEEDIINFVDCLTDCLMNSIKEG